MMKTPLLISACGLSRSGKNTFCDLLARELKQRFNLTTTQLSFAQQLRTDLENFVKFCGYDVWSETNKEDFRSLMLWYGDLRRKQTNGTYFWGRVKRQIKTLNTDTDIDIVTISDLRYKFYEYDEIDFCQSQGVVVHISKYNMVMGLGSEESNNLIKKFDDPPNELEAKNDPILKAASDYQIVWKNQNGKIENLQSDVSKFVDWLVEKKYIQ